jgi:hypothetical protein
MITAAWLWMKHHQALDAVGWDVSRMIMEGALVP